MRILCLLVLLVSAAVCGAERPNVLFIIADDASRSFGEAYGCSWAKTPHIDKLARSGLVFDNAYTPTSKCAPSRAAIMTGRNPWQLEDAANHQPSFPVKFTTFTEALNKAGVATGSAGKTWGPGAALTADGQPRSFALGGPGFREFLKGKPKDAPFFYWFGSKNPHRPYQLNAGLAAGKKPSDVTHVPGYWPDNEEVRRDMLDYATEIEAYDAEVGELLTALEASGEAANTLIIVTSDHGMPFPRVKGHTIDEAHHIPFVASWPKGITKPGRVADMVSFIDIAPTLLDLFQVDGPAQGMSPITGRSFTDLLRGEPSMKRDFVIIGRERNDVLARLGTPSGLGYPARGLREGSFLYVQNFEPDRWPCGEESIGFTDTDNSPTKSLIQALGASSPYWQFAFGKRPAQQLFDLSNDPDCVKNLATEAPHAERLKAMQTKLLAELTKQADPRVLGQGAVFDNYVSPKALTKPSKKNKGKKAPLP